MKATLKWISILSIPCFWYAYNQTFPTYGVSTESIVQFLVIGSVGAIVWGSIAALVAKLFKRKRNRSELR